MSPKGYTSPVACPSQKPTQEHYCTCLTVGRKVNREQYLTLKQTGRHPFLFFCFLFLWGKKPDFSARLEFTTTFPYIKSHSHAVASTVHFFFFSFYLISLIADEPHDYHPACGHKGSSHLSPVHALQFFIAMQVQHSHNSSTNG